MEIDEPLEANGSNGHIRGEVDRPEFNGLVMSFLKKEGFVKPEHYRRFNSAKQKPAGFGQRAFQIIRQSPTLA